MNGSDSRAHAEVPVRARASICAQAHGRAGPVAGNYCTVVKHHYSLICPAAPSVLLSATFYAISTAPRTTPPEHACTCTHTHHPSRRAQAYRTPLITSPSSPSILNHCPLFSPYAALSPLCMKPASLFCCSLTNLERRPART